MSFLDKIFPPSQAANQQTQQAPQQQVQQPQVQEPVSQPVDPLDSLWNNEGVKSTKGIGIDFTINPEQLAEIAGKLDYSQVVTPEMRTRLSMGGDEAVAATLEALNAVQRMGYQQNAVATTKLIEAAVKANEATINDKIDARLKLSGLNDSLASTHPALTNPKYGPLVESTKQQIISKFPNATQTEINKMTVSYLEAMAADMNPELVTKAAANTQVGLRNLNAMQPEQDWAAWLSQ